MAKVMVLVADEQFPRPPGYASDAASSDVTLASGGENEQSSYQSRSGHTKQLPVLCKYACNQCGYEAILEGQLRNHVKSTHEEMKYGCPQCDYTATRQGSLKRHIKSVHEGEKYDCSQEY